MNGKEDLMDALAFDKARNRDDEMFPADILDQLLAGENPVKVFRRYRKLSQVALADKSGLSQAVISGIETGARRGTVDNFLALAQALDVEIDDLL